MFESTGKASRSKILLSRSVRVSLLTYHEYSQLNKTRFILASAMQFGEVAADIVLCQFGERNIQFSQVIFEINPLFKIRGDVSITDFEDKYLEKISSFMYVKMQQLMTDNMKFTELF